MKIVDIYKSHHGASDDWVASGNSELFTSIFDVPDLEVNNAKGGDIRDHVKNKLIEQGWVMEFRLEQLHQLYVTAVLNEHAFQLQTGNIARAAYDMLKIQYLYQSKKISAATLAVPTNAAAKVMGSNIANFERVVKELKLFDRVITVPLIVIAFE